MKQVSTNRKEIQIWEVVNHDTENNEIIMLDYVFNHGNGFKGATGSVFQPINREEYNDMMDEDNFIEYLIDSGVELPEAYKRTGFEGLAAAMIRGGEVEGYLFDLSYREHWNKLRALGYSEEEYPVFNCIGGGRCFDKGFKGNVNPKLTKLINDYES